MLLLHRGIGEALGDPVAVGFVGELLAIGGQVVLAVGVLEMGEELGPFAHADAAGAGAGRGSPACAAG